MQQEIERQQRWIRHRDANAFTELVHEHAGMVFGTCRRILNNATEAEDVAQECFMEFARARKVVTPSLGGWLHRVAVFRSLNRIRGERRRKVREEHFASTHPTTTQPEWDDIKPHLDEAIAKLPEKFRMAVVQRFLSGKTQEEVARSLGVSRSTAQYRIQRGVEEIRKFLNARGVTAAAAALVAAMEANAREAAPMTLVAALGERAIAAYPAALGPVAGAFSGWIKLAAVGLLLAVLVAVAGIKVLRGDVPQSVTQIQGVSEITVDFGAFDLDVTPSRTEPDSAAALNVSTPVLMAMNEHKAEEPSVSGLVFSEETQVPLAGFLIMAFPEGARMDGRTEPTAEATSGDDGSFDLFQLPEGRYSVHAVDSVTSYQVKEHDRKEGSSAPQRGGQVDIVIAGNGATHAELPVSTGRCLVGQVRRADGSLAAGATVWARGESAALNYWAERSADSNGRFLFFGMDEDCTLRLQATDGIATSEVSAPLAMRAVLVESPDVVLQDAASIAGDVVSPSGQAVPGAVAWLRSDAEFVVRPRFFEADENGRFEVGGLPPGRYDILLAPYRSGRDDVSNGTTFFYWGAIEKIFTDGEPVLRLPLRPAERKENIQLRYRGGEITGRVTDLSGIPIAGATVGIHQATSVETDNDGYYRLDGVTGEPVNLFAYQEEFKSSELRGIAANTRGADFRLERKGVITGQVVDAQSGAPITEFELYAGPDGPYEGWMERSFRPHSDPEGRFTRRPDFETERVFARANGYAVNSALAEGVVDGQPPTEILIALSPGIKAHGIVVTQAGTPVARALVFRDAVPNMENKLEGGAVAVTNNAGEFSVDSLPEEPVTLASWKEGVGYGRAVTHGAAGEREPVRITLAPSGSLEGLVTASGTPLDGVTIVASSIPRVIESNDQMRPPMTSAYAQTDSGGVFSIADLPAGNVQISGNYDGRNRVVNVEVVPGMTTTLRFDFPPLTATLEGQILYEDGSLVDRGTLILSMVLENEREMFFVEWIDGVYRLDGLPAGEAEVTLNIGTEIPRRVVELWQIEDGAAMMRDINLSETIPIGHVVGEGGPAVQVIVPLVK